MIYFISDIHLGSKVMPDAMAHQQRFIALLKKMQKDATAIYLLGDVFDFWYEYYWSNKRHLKQFDPVLDALREATAHCPVHFFIGNHDMWTWGWLAKRTGVEVHYHPEVMTIQGKRCFLAHGDGLGCTDKRFRFLRAFFHNPIPRVLYRLLPPAFGDWVGYTWAASSRRKEMVNPLGYKGEKKEELLMFARGEADVDVFERMGVKPEEIDCFVFGHRHIELAFMLPNRACVYILGDFFRQFTYAQMDEKGNITIEYDGEEWYDREHRED